VHIIIPVILATEGTRVMERFPTFKRGDRTMLVSLLDPYRYVREADRALERGDSDHARALIAQAYLAFDLCAAGVSRLGLGTRSCGKEITDRDVKEFGQRDQMLGRDAIGGAFIGLDRIAANAECPGEIVLGEPEGAAFSSDAASDMLVDQRHECSHPGADVISS
jgi:hypothetical protein